MTDAAGMGKVSGLRASLKAAAKLARASAEQRLSDEIAATSAFIDATLSQANFKALLGKDRVTYIKRFFEVHAEHVFPPSTDFTCNTCVHLAMNPEDSGIISDDDFLEARCKMRERRQKHERRQKKNFTGKRS